MPVHLKDLPVADPDRNIMDRQGNLAGFIALPSIAQLGWPDAVIEGWLFDHGSHEPFLQDYGSLDLSEISWSLEQVPLDDLALVRTGPSEQWWLEEAAELHAHWLSRRSTEIQKAWQTQGTWLAPPLFVRYSLPDLSASGLQLVEGRTRVGILQGRRAAGLRVAETHIAWVGQVPLTRG